MKERSVTELETERVNSLHELSILDTPPEERFDRVTRLAKQLFRVSIATVSLIDANRQWFKSCFGVDITEGDRDSSICNHTIMGDSPLIVPDTLQDERFVDNVYVTQAPFVRFYAGYPLKSTDGYNLGTLCIIDDEPREFSEQDLALFCDLGMLAQQELQAIELATIDDLTEISNRRGFLALAKHSLAVCKRHDFSATLLFFDLNKFKVINDSFGHKEGDNALRAFSDCLLFSFRESDIIARLGGDEFVVLISNQEPIDIDKAVKRLKSNLSEINLLNNPDYDIEYSIGRIDVDNFDQSIEQLISKADREMYKSK
jgi:diguanylate cyclase (GGDEF)-like protein